MKAILIGLAVAGSLAANSAGAQLHISVSGNGLFSGQQGPQSLAAVQHFGSSASFAMTLTLDTAADYTSFSGLTVPTTFVNGVAYHAKPGATGNSFLSFGDNGAHDTLTLSGATDFPNASQQDEVLIQAVFDLGDYFVSGQFTPSLPSTAYLTSHLSSFTLQYRTDGPAGYGAASYNNLTGFGLQISGSLPQVADPVPEPANWAMMIAGFGLVGTSTRRRSSRIIQAI